LKETLRKWPVVSELYRIASEELIVNDYKLPKGTWIMVRIFIAFN
jgi:cytochrome P450